MAGSSNQQAGSGRGQREGAAPQGTSARGTGAVHASSRLLSSRGGA